MKTAMKIISVIVTLAMLMTLSSMAFAIDRANDSVDVVGADQEALKAAFTEETEFNGIKATPSGEYAMEITAETTVLLIPVGRLDVDISNESSLDMFLTNQNVSEVAKQRLLEKQQYIDDNGLKPFSAAYFSPKLLNAESNTAMTRGSSYWYYTYNGYPMVSERLYTYGYSTKFVDVASGTNTGQIINGLFNIALIAAGMANISFGFVYSGISLLAAILNLVGGNYVSGTTSDFMQIFLEYDDCSQWTYLIAGSEWWLGLCTQEVTVNRVGFYGKLGGVVKGPNAFNVSATQRSAHFSSPWSTAWANAGSIAPPTEWLSWKIGNTTILF